MEAIVLAGGLGTRLSSKLTNLPKSMALVAGRPFLEILLDQLIDAGCTRVILSVGHLRHIILQTFQQSYRGVPLDYAVEEEPLGTGGAICTALQRAQEPSVFVLNGDTFLDVDLPAMFALHLSAGCPMTMAVVRVENVARYGGVAVENGHITGFIEKGRVGPGWINAGAYVVRRDFPWPENLAARFSFETEVLAPFLGRLSPAAFFCEGYFLDIGIPKDLDRAQVDLADKNRKPPQ
jgi:D-glycero-alpha-D-manno-heptose 1-phosphate guanylyltransferase